MQYLKTFRTKILLLVIISLVVVAGLVSALSLNYMREAASDAGNKSVQMLCEKEAALIGVQFNSVEQSTDLLHKYLDQNLSLVNRGETSMDKVLEDMSMITVGAASNIGSVSSVFLRMDSPDIGQGVGFLMIRDGEKFKRSTLTDITQFDKNDVQNVGWYYLPKESGKAMWMAPYVDYKQQVLMTSYVIPIDYNGEMIGVIGMDISLEYIHTMINSMNVFDQGYSFLTYNGQPLGNVVDRRGDPDWTSSTVQCTDSLAVCEIAPNPVINSNANRLMTISVIVTLIVLAAAIVITSFITLRINRRLSETVESANKAQQEALEAEKHAHEAKTMFLNNMSHDIRTPMNAIMGFTELAASKVDDAEKVRDYLHKIQISSNHLLALINDVLDMSRIESGKMEIETSAMSLPEVLSEIESIIHGNSKASLLEMRYELVDIKDEYVMCDKLRLSQVLLNCMSNALKFTPEGGAVTLRITQREGGKEDIAEKRHADKHLAFFDFLIEDTGIGMSEDFAQKIFEPFEREKTSTVSGIQGTGLGMAITKSIIDAMGGTIFVESAQGEGTKIKIALAFEVADSPQDTRDNSVGNAEAMPLSEDNASVLEGMKILLVDDNAMNRKIAAEIIEEYGASVDTAEDGSIAIEKLMHASSDDYDLILMDIQMPVTNGYEATRAIRSMESDKAGIPIIALSADAFVEARRMSIEAGMNGHVAKPLDIDNLLETIANVMRSKA